MAKDLESALQEFTAAREFHRELYQRRDDCIARRSQLLSELEQAEKGTQTVEIDTVDDVLEAANFTRNRSRELKAAIEKVEAVIEALEDKFSDALARERQAEQALVAARWKVAEEALERFRASRAFKNFARDFTELLALAEAASGAEFGGRLNRDRWIARVFEGIEPSKRQIGQARDALMLG